MYLNLITTIAVFGLQTAINFFLAPYILKVLGDEAYGFLALANSLVNYGFILTMVINSVAGRFIASAYHRGNWLKASKFYSSVLIINFLFSIIMALISLIFLIKIQSIINISQTLINDVRLTIAIYFINFSVGLFNGVLGIHAFIKNQMYLISIRNAISTAIYAMSVLLLFYLFDAMIYYTAVAALISSIFVFFSYLYLNRKFSLNLGFKYRYFKINFIKFLAKSGLFNSINTLSYVLLSEVGLFLVNIYISAASMGIWAVSRSASVILESLVFTTSISWNPQFVKIHADNTPLRDAVVLALKSVSFIALPLIASFVALADEFYRLWLPFKSQDEIDYIYDLVLISILPSIVFASSRPLMSINLITNQLKRPALVMLFVAICVFCIEIVGLSFFEFGLREIMITICVGIVLKVTLFDVANAGANLGIGLGAFYPIYFKNLAIFAFILGVLYPISKMLEISSWVEFFIYASGISILGYLIAFVMVFNSKERRNIINKIRRRRS